MKSQIVYRIVNYDKNIENLKDSPYIQFMDLAIVVYVEFPVDGITSGAVLVKNEHLELWGVTKEEVLKQALSTKVSVNGRGDGTGKIEIEFFSHDDFDRLMEILTKNN